MAYKNKKIADVAELLEKRFEKLEDKQSILKAIELKALYGEIPTLPEEERANFGKEINQLKSHLEKLANAHQEKEEALEPIDVD